MRVTRRRSCSDRLADHRGRALGGRLSADAAARHPARSAALGLALVNQAGLVGWNEVYFGRRMMGTGTIAAGALVLSSGASCVTASRSDRVAATTGAPLTLWLCFATLLAGSGWRRKDGS